MSGTHDLIDYRRLFHSAPTAFLVLDPALVIVDANDAYLVSSMRTRQELVGQPVFDAFPDNPNDPAAGGAAALEASLRRVLRERVTDVLPIQKYDIPLPGGGFAVRYWSPVNAPVFGPDGELLYIVHRAEDVTTYVEARQHGTVVEELTEELRVRTEQIEAEVFARQRLQRENDTLQAVIDSLDAAVVGCDADGLPVLSNQAARDLVGEQLDGVPAWQWPQRLHLHDGDGRPLTGDQQPMVRALHGERVRDAEVIIRAPGTAQRHFRVHGRPVTARPGLAAVVAMHETTVHRRAIRFKECELEVAKVISKPQPADEILGQVVQLIATMIGWSAAEFWTVDDVAQVLRRVTCWAEAHHDLPCHLLDPLLPGQGLPGRAWHSKEPVWAADLHTDADAAHQTTNWGNLHAAIAIPIPSGAVVLGVLVCYSDTREVPDDVRTATLTGIGAHLGEFLERRRAEGLAAELDRTRDEYIALVGHELRTPLTTIQAYTELMLDDPAVPAEQRPLLTAMQRNATGLHTIVAKLLDVAGLRSRHISLHPQPMDLAAVVHAAANAARRSTADPITVEVNTPARVHIVGDPARLRQVADELLGNALTWAADGSTIGINLHADDRAAALTVTNTGQRIPDDERARLFDLFFRGDAARHRGIPGTGLGLTLTRAIIEQHGGNITVSEPDEAATTFTIRLPTRHPEPQPPGPT